MHELSLRCIKADPKNSVFIDDGLKLALAVNGYFPICKLMKVIASDESAGPFEILLRVLHLDRIPDFSPQIGTKMELMYPLHSTLWATCSVISAKEISDTSE
jgi:hypothetical protein